MPKKPRPLSDQDPVDRIIAMAAALLDAPIAAVAMTVGGTRVLRSVRDGLVTERSADDCGETNLITEADGSLVILDLTTHPQTAANPFVQGPAGCRFYAGAAIKDKDGVVIGSLCVLDVVERQSPSSDSLRLLRMLADQAASAVAQTNMAHAQAEKVQLLRIAESLLGLGHWRLDYVTGKVTWSEEVYRIHGLDPETFDPSLDDALDAYHPADRALISHHVEQSLITGEGFECQLRIRRPDGSVRLTQSNGRCLKDGDGQAIALFGVFQDITERDAGERRLRESEERYRLLADNASDMIATFRPNGEITFVSPASRLVLGYDPEELVGQQMTDFTHPDDCAAMLDHYKGLFRQGPGGSSEPYHFRSRRKDGKWIWLEGQPKVFFDPDTGHPLEILDVARDVTKRKELELALSQARRDAEAATVAKANFLATMSHEIRTPLNGVLGFSDLLTSTPLNADQQLYVSRIRTAGRGLSALIDDILDFSRIEAGALSTNDHVYALDAMFAEVVDLVERGCADKPVTFRVDIADDVADPLCGDDLRIRQVLLNLIGNAAKFTPSGTIDVTAAKEDGFLVLRVSDTGPGIASEDLESVFEGFNQGDSSITRRFGGSGLGLSISRSLAELMGGELSLISTVGVGTTAVLTLPYREAVDAVQPAQTVGPKTQGLVGLRVMVVDDGAINRELAELALRERGHDVTTFADAPSAIAALCAGQDVDVILMDVQMPGMDGLAATRAIRALSCGAASLPIIAVTANVLPAKVQACIAAGMNDHVPKPVDFDRLASVFDRLVQPGTARAPAGKSAPGDPGPTSLEDLTAGYARHLAGLPDQLERLARQGQSDQIAQMAHSIAGTAGSFGFPAVSDAAFTLETAARSKGPVANTVALERATRKLSAAIHETRLQRTPA